MRFVRLVSLPPVLACFAAIGFAAPAAAEQDLYVTHGSVPGGLTAFTIGAGGTLGPVVGSPYALSAFPGQMAISPLTHDLYAGGGGPYGFSASPTDGALTPLSGSPFAPNGESVADLAISPDGQRVFAVTGLNNKLRVYDVGADEGLTQVGPAYAPGNTPLGLALSPDGKNLFAPLANANTIAAYNVAVDGTLTLRPDSPFSTGSQPFGAAVTPDGKFLYVSNFGGASVSAYNILPSGSLLQVSGSPFAVGSQPYELAISPDGAHLYTANQGSGNVSAKTIAADGTLSNVTGSPFAAGAGAKGIAMTPDGKHLYTANLFANNVTAYNVAGNGALATVAGSPYAIPTGGNGAVVTPDRTPTADFTATDAAGRTVNLNGSGSTDNDGTVVRYDWDFGDGITASDAAPTLDHTYAADGTYDVKLTVTDDMGCSTELVYTGRSPYCPIGTPAALTKQVVVDTAVTGAKLKAKGKQRVGGGKIILLAKVKTGEQVDVTVGGKISAGSKSFALKKVTKNVLPGGAKKIKLKLKKPTEATKVERALGRKVKAAIKAGFTDAAGNRAKRKAKVTLLPK